MCVVCASVYVSVTPLAAPGAAFPEVAVFTVVMGGFLDLASWSAVMQRTCEFLGDNYGVSQ